MQSAALEIGKHLLHSSIVISVSHVLSAKKAVKDNSVEKDIAQFIKKEVGTTAVQTPIQLSQGAN